MLLVAVVGAFGLCGEADARPKARRVRAQFVAMRCTPPSADKVRALEATLAQVPARVRADLAYFLAAIEGAGPAVGRADDATPRAGGAEEGYAMRALAAQHEARGNFAQAAALYRRANPGGGPCGTSVGALRAEQIAGVIRAEQALGHCGAVVAERLIATSEGDEYGPELLAEKGYDVGRLYRGALATAAGDGEDWAARVYAFAGLAELGGRAAIPVLVAHAQAGRPETRAEAMRVLGELAQGSAVDPCDRSIYGFGMIGIGGMSARRALRPLSEKCETRLDDAEAERLARALLPAMDDADETVSWEATNAIGEIGSAAMLPVLRKKRGPIAASNEDRPRTVLEHAIEHIEELERDRAQAKARR